MAEVLSQQEIDQLLSNMKTGTEEAEVGQSEKRLFRLTFVFRTEFQNYNFEQ